jgi:hypothetical protein
VGEDGAADPYSGHLFEMNEDYAAYGIRPSVKSGRRLHAYTYNDTTGSWNVNMFSANLAADTAKWTHFAMTYDGSGTARLFIDGLQAAQQTGVSPDIQANSPMAIGKAAAYAYMVAPVSLGGIRYSRVVRYSTAFTPSAAWAVDSSTIAQFLTQQGLGTTLVDEAGGDNTGTVAGGWIAETNGVGP